MSSCRPGAFANYFKLRGAVSMVTMSSSLRFLGRIGQGSLAARWTGGAFLSQAYLKKYWCVMFLFDAARRLVAREIASPAGTFAGASPMPLRSPESGIGTAPPAQAASGAPGYLKSHP